MTLPHQDPATSIFRRPPEPIWMLIVTGLAIWEITHRDWLGAAISLPFLLAQVLARPTWRVPLWLAFTTIAGCETYAGFHEHAWARAAVYAVITCYGADRLWNDARAGRARAGSGSEH